uniref:WAP domain-containing protein n=1 Tax=Phasianus colchicus TaxID=9054 RepID=A0A669NVW3_PHACC
VAEAAAIPSIGRVMLGAALTPHPATGELQKPGRCPRDFTRCLHQEPPLCTNDSACPGWLKCCSHECRLRCTPPAEEKPGACPAAAPEGLFYPCSFRCQEDKDCLGSQKCCPLGCGQACVEPAQGKASGCQPGHRVQPGARGWGGGGHLAGRGAPTWRDAAMDQAMHPAHVCWTVSPWDHWKDGFCPASAGLFPSYDCREWCRRDADCPGEEKCCLQGCDYVCLRPAQGWSH